MPLNMSPFALQMMNNMGGEDDLPDMDGADDVRSFPYVKDHFTL